MTRPRGKALVGFLDRAMVAWPLGDTKAVRIRARAYSHWTPPHMGWRLHRKRRRGAFTTDFPSATFLASHDMQRVMLIQKDKLEPESDLAHSLQGGQEGDLKLERLRLNPSTRPEPFRVARPTWYGAMFQRALSSIGLRRAGGGGFGAWVSGSFGGG